MSLSFGEISTFIRLASLLKRDILQPQPLPETDPDQPPAVLPPSIAAFLSDALHISPSNIFLCWEVLKEEVWATAVPEETKQEDLEIFRSHGRKYGITYYTLYPPSAYCTNMTGCDRTKPLKQEKTRQVVVFTLANGAQPAWAVNLVCTECKTTYHNNFSVCQGTRTYYEDIPQFLQVGEHQFVEDHLVDSWVGMILLGWFSASNCARHYSTTISRLDEASPDEWRFTLKVEMEQVWDALVLKSLLEDCQQQSILLQVPHTGDQAERFTTAMQERNERIVRQGQPEVLHACDKCMRVFEDKSGVISESDIVGPREGSGACMRRPQPLSTTKDRFCPNHASFYNICAVNGCDRLVVPGCKTCSDVVHQDMEKKYTARGQAFFTLQDRYRKANQQDPDDDDQWYELVDNQVKMFTTPNSGSIGQPDDPNAITYPTTPTCDSKSEEGNKKLKAQFGRRRTHNKQILVRPCGIIYARATLYGAEAVSNVIHFTKTACSVPGAHKPDLLVYNTACAMAEQLVKAKDQWWDDVGLVADVFQ
ncbi:hypothetical protein K435DRAFT_644489 [Dendrothele bispora CBS 962.96]|uniref:CxC5 like cysteine cluster associated with KDZ domain-containing protein n=1 Tax=Dendrothele bispora (strain CBS 962.96) TaxID=1314807 RepID=A0A4V4HII8_DENBC|nr:hypothetical protein K435DRAFT_644489 [Dendrothele bispora CBS 962.96]